MRKYELDMEKHEYKSTAMMADSEEEAIHEAETQYPGFRVVAIDDVAIIGKCEGCRKVLRHDDDGRTTDDGPFCDGCWKQSEADLELEVD